MVESAYPLEREPVADDRELIVAFGALWFACVVRVAAVVLDREPFGAEPTLAALVVVVLSLAAVGRMRCSRAERDT